MSEDYTQKQYDTLKKLGFKIEQQINQAIQDHVNKEEFAEFAGLTSLRLASLIEHLQQFVETVSIPLNLPTKKDIANIGRILIQTEEKVDSLDEQVYHLTALVEKLISELKEHNQKQAELLLEQKSPDENLSNIPDQQAESVSKEALTKEKRLMKMNLISEASKKYSEILLKNLLQNSQEGNEK